MPERDRAAVDVDFLRIEIEFLHAGQRLRRKGFVQLDQVDLVKRESGLLEHLADRRDRADAKQFRLHARRRVADESRERRQAALAREFERGDDRGGGAVAGLR